MTEPAGRRRRHTTATDPRLTEAVLRELAASQLSPVDDPPGAEDAPAPKADQQSA